MEQTQVPRLQNHFRLQGEEAQGCHVLLYPEGMVQLNGSAGTILSCIDGNKTVAAIIEELQARFPDAEGIAGDIMDFLETARQQRWIDLD